MAAFTLSTQNENGLSSMSITFAVAAVVMTALPMKFGGSGGLSLVLISTANKTEEVARGLSKTVLVLVLQR